MRDVRSRPFTAEARQVFVHAVLLYARDLAFESRRVARRLRLGTVSQGCVELALTALSGGRSRDGTPMWLSFGGLVAGAGFGYALELSSARLVPVAEVAVAVSLLVAGTLAMVLAGRGGGRAR